MTIDSDTIGTGVDTAVTNIVDDYLTGSNVLDAMYGDVSGLDIDTDTATVLTTDAIDHTANWDALTAADPDDYAQDAVRDFIADISANALAAQESLALAITTTLHDAVAISGSVEDAVAAYLNGETVGAYVDKATGNIVVSETTLSSTTYIPIGDYLVGAGKAVEAFAIYETFKDTISDSYHATLGDEQAAFNAAQDYLVAATATITGGTVAGELPVGGPTGQAAVFAGFGGLAGWEAKDLSNSLASIIHDAKVDGKTEAETLALVQSDIVTAINSQWTTSGTAAENMLNSVHDLVGSMYDGVQGLVDGNGWCPAPPLPAAITDALTPWAEAPNEISPLLIDLSGTGAGIQLTEFNASTTSTFFDLTGDGFAQQTAWTTGDATGFLVRDLNSNGVIDNITEMFGSSTVDGFAQLATLDSNHDLKIDSHDTDWGTLQVWIDANGDGVTQSGELHSLTSLGIVSIDLAGVASSSSTIEGNAISHTSTVTFSDNSTSTIADAWFANDPVDSYYNGSYTLDADTLTLPDLRGYGTLPELTIAMSEDSTLKGMVSDFASGFGTTGFASFSDSDVANILYQWAGVEGVDPTSRGTSVNAQSLEFLEHLFAQNFVQGSTQSADPMADAAADITHSWNTVFEQFKDDMILQAGGSSLFTNSVTYDPLAGTTSGDTSLSHTAIEALATNAPGDPGENLTYWTEVGNFLNTIKGIDNVTMTEAGWLDTTIYSTNHDLSWDDIVNAVGGVVPTNTINGTTGSETITGTDAADTIEGYGGGDTIHGGNANDVIYATTSSNFTDTASSTLYGDAGSDSLYGAAGHDTLYGGDGNDTLYGEDGNDTLSGGSGGNTVYGGAGDDTYVYTAGADDLYSEAHNGTGGADQILLPSGIVLADLSFARVSSNDGENFDDLLITFSGGGSIQIQDHFLDSSYQIETLVFNDSSTLDLTALTPNIHLDNSGVTFEVDLSSVYTGGETVYGGDGADYIRTYGTNDTLDGGAGNDTLQGGAGNDTYIASTGFDTIIEQSGTDVIVVPSGYTSDDITIYRGGGHSVDDLIIDIKGLGEIDVQDHFLGTDYAVESLHFLADGTDMSLTDQTILTLGTTGNDSLSAPSYNAGADNIFDGREGNDTLVGGTGNDTYVFSQGHDTVEEYGGTDTIQVRDGYSPSDVTVYHTPDGFSAGQDDLVVADNDGNTITVLHQFASSGDAVEYISFSDGTVWTIADMIIEGHGTASADTMYGLDYTGAQSSDVLYGYGGNDTMRAGSGNDSLYGGDGDDVLIGGSGNVFFNGGSGDNYFLGGAGNNTADYHDAPAAVTVSLASGTADNGWGGTDSLSSIQNVNGSAYDDAITGDSNANILYGGGGNDTLTGGSGADTFLFKAATAFTGSATITDFNTGQNDKIDIADVLSGHYHPLTDAIADFVQLTTSGSNTLLKVDLDGTGGTYSPTTIATIQGVTGLDLATLITDHHLVVTT